MHSTKHPIAIEDNVATFQLTSFHYGRPGRGKKVYIQASLHADEVPAMLVAHFLRQELDRLDAEGRIKGEIILVPAANPIGLSQTIHGTPFGRYDLSTGVNFNRAYKHVATDLKKSLEGKLGQDAEANVALIRTHALASLETWEPNTSAGLLKKILLSMAIDADIMLDLHCDNEAVLHMYCGEPLAEAVQPLADLMGAHALLLARESGGEPFDEACSPPVVGPGRALRPRGRDSAGRRGDHGGIARRERRALRTGASRMPRPCCNISREMACSTCRSRRCPRRCAHRRRWKRSNPCSRPTPACWSS